MARATISGGVTLEYESEGSGDPILFFDGVFIAFAFRLVARSEALGDYRRITYARRGYAGSDPPAGPMSIELQATDCLSLLAALGVERAHVVGHSYGGAIALQLTAQAPDAVRSLCLLEPALILGASAEGYRDSLAATVRRGGEAGTEVAVDEFMSVRAPGYRAHLDRDMPGAFAQAVTDARTPLEVELPALPDWRFTETMARAIKVPTLSVLGQLSRDLSPRFQEAHASLLEWIPDCESAIIPHAAHFMVTQEPEAVATALSTFLRKLQGH